VSFSPKDLAAVLLLACTALAQSPLPAEIHEFDRLLAEEKYVDVEQSLQRYTAEHPRSAEAWYQLGYVYYRVHKIWPSVVALSRSLALNPKQAHAHRILGLNFTILGRLDLAKRELDRAVVLDPQSAESHYSLGRVFYEEGDYRSAAKHLNVAVLLQPEYVKALHNLGLTYEALDDLTRARELFEKAIDYDEKSSRRSEWPYINFGSFLNRRAEFASAEQVLLKGQSINAESGALEFELAKAYRGLEQWQAAAECLEKARKLSPGNAEYLYVLSLTYRSLGRRDKADEVLAEFAELKAKASANP
jgi:protein O-GlcNAc transferase